MRNLKEVNIINFLVWTLTLKMTFNNHGDSICKRASSRPSRAFLSRKLRSCTKDTRDITYKTHVRPTVEYASTVWDPHTDRITNKLEQLGPTRQSGVANANATLPGVSQATEIITAVPHCRQNDPRPWNSATETAA